MRYLLEIKPTLKGGFGEGARLHHFHEKFVPSCHVCYFINNDRQKLTTEYIYRTFYTFRD